MGVSFWLSGGVGCLGKLGVSSFDVWLVGKSGAAEGEDGVGVSTKYILFRCHVMD